MINISTHKCGMNEGKTERFLLGTVMLGLVFLLANLGVASAQIRTTNERYYLRDSKDFSTTIAVGVKVGGNLSNVYSKTDNDFVADPKLGWAFGGFLAIPIGQYLGVQPEVLFSQKGFRSSGDILGSTYDIKRTSSYLDVPLLVAFKPTDFLSILAGPQYSYLLKQKNEFENGTTSIDQEQAFDNENVRKNTLCFTFGADLNINNTVVGARAGWDVRHNTGDGNSTSLRYKNMWYQMTLGYRF